MTADQNESINKTTGETPRKKIQDMSSDELRIWISACDKMENWVKYNKARRSWTESRDQAIGELERRNEG